MGPPLGGGGGNGVRLKLTFWVVWPAVTGTVSVPGLKPLAEAVRVWSPGASPARVYRPEPSVVALAPPLSLTVAPAMAAPDTLVTVPLTAPMVGDGVRLKLTFWVVPALIEAVFVKGVVNPLAEAVRVCMPGVSPVRM